MHQSKTHFQMDDIQIYLTHETETLDWDHFIEAATQAREIADQTFAKTLKTNEASLLFPL